jgi:hypothetical protein
MPLSNLKAECILYFLRKWLVSSFVGQHLTMKISDIVDARVTALSRSVFCHTSSLDCRQRLKRVLHTGGSVAYDGVGLIPGLL